MKNRDNIVEVKASLDVLWFMFGSALRYGLGRQSYAPDLIARVIKDNLPLLNEKWTVNLLRDFNDYERDRIVWQKNKDDLCQSCLELRRLLLELYAERGYKHPID